MPAQTPRSDRGGGGTRRTGSTVRANHPTIAALSPAQVRAIQRKVGVPVDGSYGPVTMAAVKRYQQSHGLAVDGVAGPNTLAKMGLAGGGGGGSRSGGSAGDVSAAVRAAQTGARAGERVGQAEVAAQFGYTQSFFNSDPELKKLLSQATSGNWTQARFVAALQGTKWFRKHGESYRKYIALKSGDPATFKQTLQQAKMQITNAAASMGLSGSALQNADGLADQMLKFGWTEDQLKNALIGQTKANKYGRWQGDAGTWKTKFQQIASSYGVKVSDDHMGQWVRGALRGKFNEAYVTQYAQDAAVSRYPGLKERLLSGETLDQIADPYRQSYAQILEVNPDTVKLSDPLIQRALQAKTDKGKPTTQTIYQFEQNLRSDPRWLKTQNAQDDTQSVAHQVLKDFGMVGS